MKDRVNNEYKNKYIVICIYIYIRHDYNDSTEFYCSLLIDRKTHCPSAVHSNSRSLFSCTANYFLDIFLLLFFINCLKHFFLLLKKSKHL